jgi:soluble lytic murein transglycosylase
MVRAAKIALLRGFPVDAYAFPTLLPKFDSAGGNDKLEPALLNALTRQESDFHTGSVSRVGARGLMQLMPQTARLVASTYKQKYDVSRLISDPSYNVTLGSAFLSELISGYDGSYVLSLAAYNAGPGRVKQWIKDFGDPRNKSADPVDWIERIPFTETRTYVQRILESTQLYRCRFENGKAKSQIVEDLHRGRPGRLPDLEDVSGSGELEQTP